MHKLKLLVLSCVYYIYYQVKISNVKVSTSFYEKST